MAKRVVKSGGEWLEKREAIKFKNCWNYTNGLLQEEVEVILDDLEFAWKKSDIKLVINLWKYGKDIKYIIEKVNRDGDEVFLLLLHLSRTGKIKRRKNFVWGFEL